jgi:hypothetical protein
MGAMCPWSAKPRFLQALRSKPFYEGHRRAFGVFGGVPRRIPHEVRVALRGPGPAGASARAS